MTHVFARVAGFNLTVVPHAPYRMRYADAASIAIDVEYLSPNGQLFARLIPDRGGYKSKLDQDTKSLLDVLDVEAGPDLNEWRIETTVFTCCWPRGYAVCSTSFPKDPAPFDFVGGNGELIYVQHPRHLPDVGEMAAPDQTVIKVARTADSQWVDLEYDHNGIRWRKRHEVVILLDRRVAVTMQSPAQFAGDAVTAAQQVARSLAPYRGIA